MGLLLGLIGIAGGYLLIKYGIAILITGAILILTAIGLKRS